MLTLVRKSILMKPYNKVTMYLWKICLQASICVPYLLISCATTESLGPCVTVEPYFDYGRIRRLVVFPSAQSTGAPDLVADTVHQVLGSRLTAELVPRRTYTIVERKQLEEVLKEIRLNVTTIFIDRATATRIGKVTQADALLVGEFTELQQSGPYGVVDANVRLLDGATGEIIWAEAYSVGFRIQTGYIDRGDIARVAREIADAITPHMKTQRTGQREVCQQPWE